MSLEACLQHITEDSAALSYPVLIEISDLSPGELGRFARAWHKVSPDRKQKVVEGLVEMSEDSAELDFSTVLKLCLKDPDEQVRDKAITGLWEFEDRSLILSLVELLKSDGSPRVRASAAMALGKFATLAQDGKVLSRDGQQVSDSLMEALVNEDEWLEVRRRALESVAPFNGSAVDGYIRWAYGSDDLELKCSSLFAMGRTGDAPWLPQIVKEMQSPNATLRYEAAHACGELDAAEATHYLIPLLQDDDLQVQLAAIAAMGKIGGSLAKRALKTCLKSGDPALEDAVRNSLEAIQSTQDPLGFNYDG